MRDQITIAVLIVLLAPAAFALQPTQILIIANGDNAESVRVADYYCQRRGVPEQNVLKLALGKSLTDDISRPDYDKLIAQPVREKLSAPEFSRKIKCLLTVYGVPFRVGGRGTLKGEKEALAKIEQLLSRKKSSPAKEPLAPGPDRYRYSKLAKQAQEEEWAFSRLIKEGYYGWFEKVAGTGPLLKELKNSIDVIKGVETSASVDSELSMVMFDDYKLYRWQPNELKQRVLWFGVKTKMVSRLDGPGADIAIGIVDKAISAEKNGLKGNAYIDWGYAKNWHLPLHVKYDKSLQKTISVIQERTQMNVFNESTTKVFRPGDCPQTAVYCGWYSLKKYIDAFDFVDGAVGYHIASLEAVDLRNPDSTQWCPAMLKDGITATIGAVAEPYLGAFPEPKLFFTELFKGKPLAEAFYRTKPRNSWMMLLIGDPLYKPFKRSTGSSGG